MAHGRLKRKLLARLMESQSFSAVLEIPLCPLLEIIAQQVAMYGIVIKLQKRFFQWN